MDANKLFEIFDKLRNDAKLNETIKKAKSFEDLAYGAAMWALPLMLTWAATRAFGKKSIAAPAKA